MLLTRHSNYSCRAPHPTVRHVLKVVGQCVGKEGRETACALCVHCLAWLKNNVPLKEVREAMTGQRLNAGPKGIAGNCKETASIWHCVFFTVMTVIFANFIY